jgi:hypothetical protein
MNRQKRTGRVAFDYVYLLMYVIKTQQTFHVVRSASHQNEENILEMKKYFKMKKLEITFKNHY